MYFVVKEVLVNIWAKFLRTLCICINLCPFSEYLFNHILIPYFLFSNLYYKPFFQFPFTFEFVQGLTVRMLLFTTTYRLQFLCVFIHSLNKYALNIWWARRCGKHKWIQGPADSGLSQNRLFTVCIPPATDPDRVEKILLLGEALHSLAL